MYFLSQSCRQSEVLQQHKSQFIRDETGISIHIMHRNCPWKLTETWPVLPWELHCPGTLYLESYHPRWYISYVGEKDGGGDSERAWARYMMYGAAAHQPPPHPGRSRGYEEILLRSWQREGKCPTFACLTLPLTAPLHRALTASVISKTDWHKSPLLCFRATFTLTPFPTFLAENIRG